MTLSATSPVYWHPLVYEMAMRALYGRGFEERYRSILAQIPRGASVLDVCAGDCRIYLKYLRGHVGSYVAVEASPGMVRAARRHGIDVRSLDVRHDELPTADVVLLQASLYQFIPDHVALLERLLGQARHMLIVAEPVRNLAQSTNPLLAWIGRRSTGAAGSDCPHRFDEAMLDALFHPRFASQVVRSGLIAAGREKLYCIRTSRA